MHSQLYSKTRFSILLALLLTLLAASHVALAQEATTSTSTSPTREPRALLQAEERQASTTERREAIAENQAERQAVRSEKQAALSAERQQRVLNLSANLSNRLEAAIARLYSITERFEARISKLKAAGVDTAAAEVELRAAAEHLAKAKTTLSTIDAQVQEATTSTEPQNRWLTVREIYTTAGASIRASHQSLRTTVSLLKTAMIESDLSRAEAVNNSTTTSE
jgi:hypothetical protein